MKRSTLFLALLGASTSGFAASDTAKNFNEQLQLEDVVVTANRLPTDIKNTINTVSVFTREDIERLNPTDTFDLLNRVPGVQTSPNGGRGSATGIHVRGTSTGHTLILIDGVRVGSATSGGASLQHLDVNQIERIEVLKGASSTIYGADAVGGVIQVFTRRGTGTGLSPNVRIAGGSFGTVEGNVGVSGGSDKTRFSVNAATIHSDGFDRTDVSFPSDDDKDGYKNSSLSFNISHQLTNDVEIGLSSLHQQGKTHYDNPFGRWDNTNFTSVDAKPYDDFTVSSTSLYVANKFTSFWDSRLELGHSEDKQENHDKLYPVEVTNFNNYRDSVQWINRFTLSEQQSLLIGLDYLNDKVSSSTDYDVSSRYNQAAFAQYSLTTGTIGANLGVRYDDNQQFGDETTFNAAVSSFVGKDNQIILSYAEGFRAPTFNDLYWPADPMWGASANPNLKAESSKSYEIKWRSELTATTQLEASIYRTDIKDMISFVTIPENIAKARIDGFEANLQQDIFGWQTNLGASIINPTDQDTKNQLARRAKRTLNLDTDRKFGDFSVGANWYIASQSYDDAANTTEVAGYGLVGLRGAWQASKELSIDLKVDNIFDKKYSRAAYSYTDASFNTTSYFYQEERVSFMLGVSWTPKF